MCVNDKYVNLFMQIDVEQWILVFLMNVAWKQKYFRMLYVFFVPNDKIVQNELHVFTSSKILKIVT